MAATASAEPDSGSCNINHEKNLCGVCNVTTTSKVVKIDPAILGGTPCFAGTRVPIKTLFDYVEGGDTLDFFLEQFPSVSRAQAVQLLEDSQRALLAA